jgi:hypothetical protein
MAPRDPLSRRNVLKKCAIALAGGMAMASQTTAQTPRTANAGRKFRADVRYGAGASVQELKLLTVS